MAGWLKSSVDVAHHLTCGCMVGGMYSHWSTPQGVAVFFTWGFISRSAETLVLLLEPVLSNFWDCCMGHMHYVVHACKGALPCSYMLCTHKACACQWNTMRALLAVIMHCKHHMQPTSMHGVTVWKCQGLENGVFLNGLHLSVLRSVVWQTCLFAYVVNRVVTVVSCIYHFML